MIEFEHSPLGGSGAKRWMNCGSSFLLQRLLMLHGEFEPPVTSQFADKGNAAHELAARCLVWDWEPYQFVGQKFGDYLVHEDDLDPQAVAVYVNFCRSIKDRLKSDNTIIERTIHLPEIHPLFKGTVDFADWLLPDHDGPNGGGGELWVVDYKNGEGIGVSPFQNEQLLYYAVLLIMAHEELRNLPRDFPVHLGIVQPNYWGIFDEPDVWHTDMGTILDWGHNELLPAMQRLIGDKREMLPEDEFVSGDHCQFCPVMLDCPKLRTAFETYATKDEFLAMLSDEEISQLYGMRDDARRYGNELEKVVFVRKLGGRVITTAKLVEKQVRRIWKPGAEAAAVSKFGVQAYEPPKMKSPAGMEKLSSIAKSFALEWGFKPSSDRLTVAPLSDRRGEVTPKTNAEIFKDFAVPLEDLGW